MEEKGKKARKVKTKYLQKNTGITYFKTLTVMLPLGDPSLPVWNIVPPMDINYLRGEKP